ncbi:hypothetical protein ABID42_004464 [Arcicella rosea]|uniref:hypothetical protein n=1 Tax=Arcicella rosea TaxID=502909 RepID=UPI00345C9782
MKKLITQFWFLQRKSNNLFNLLFFFPLITVSVYNYYKTVMVGVKASFSLEYISFGLFFYLPITFVILFFPPFAYLQKLNRENKDLKQKSMFDENDSLSES